MKQRDNHNLDQNRGDSFTVKNSKIIARNKRYTID